MVGCARSHGDQGPRSVVFFTSLLKGNSLYEVAHTFAHAQLASLASSAMLRSAHLFVSSLTRDYRILRNKRPSPNKRPPPFQDPIVLACCLKGGKEK